MINEAYDWKSVSPRGLTIISHCLTIIYIALIAQVAAVSGVSYILFPELGALAHDVYSRPKGTWAAAPLLIVVTPTIAAVMGILIAQHMDYGVVSVLLCTLGTIAIIAVLRSPIAPAISAGLLPLSFSIRSWWYPPAILLGTVMLVAVSALQKAVIRRASAQIRSTNRDLVDDLVEAPPKDYRWVPFFLGFLLTGVELVKLTGVHTLLVPPLVVMGFEMFAHAEACPWADRPLILPVACGLTAFAGWVAGQWLGSGPLGAAAAVALAILILRIFDLHVPPAIAVGLLPLLIGHATSIYPFAVAGGAALLTLSFLIHASVVRVPTRA